MSQVYCSLTGLHHFSLLYCQDGNTSLHIAAMLGNIETAKAVLSAGAHPALLNDVSLS